jgi:predicted nucleotidyltransferase
MTAATFRSFGSMAFLAQQAQERQKQREILFDDARRRLREALHELAPGHEFWLFGSLAQRGMFNSASDIDLAWTTLPEGMTEFQLAAELAERLGRPVDVIELPRSRLRAKIVREGERWIA